LTLLLAPLLEAAVAAAEEHRDVRLRTDVSTFAAVLAELPSAAEADGAAPQAAERIPTC